MLLRSPTVDLASLPSRPSQASPFAHFFRQGLSAPFITTGFLPRVIRLLGHFYLKALGERCQRSVSPLVPHTRTFPPIGLGPPVSQGPFFFSAEALSNFSRFSSAKHVGRYQAPFCEPFFSLYCTQKTFFVFFFRYTLTVRNEVNPLSSVASLFS